MSGHHLVAVVRGGFGAAMLLLPVALLFGGDPVFTDLSKATATLLVRFYFGAGVLYAATWYLLWLTVRADWRGETDPTRKVSR